MARAAGKGGAVAAATNVAIKSWECDYKGDAIDVTGMDSSGAKEFIAGLTEWSGSFDGFVTGALTAVLPGTAITPITLDSAGGSTLSLAGNCIVTGMKVTSAVDGAVGVSVTFQGTGALTPGT